MKKQKVSMSKLIIKLILEIIGMASAYLIGKLISDTYVSGWISLASYNLIHKIISTVKSDLKEKKYHI